jgi:hypothetical protein
LWDGARHVWHSLQDTSPLRPTSAVERLKSHVAGTLSFSAGQIGNIAALSSRVRRASAYSNSAIRDGASDQLDMILTVIVSASGAALTDPVGVACCGVEDSSASPST